jgi:tetratricopeptide (TPR) repeat protein
VVVVGDKYTNSGKVAAFGENASAHDITFNDYKAENIIIHQATPVTYTALHQLPSPPADFVGREKEMKELLQALENGGVTITGLQGMGGIGKTALALMLANQLKPKYPDAQFYLDLKGASKQPLSAKDAMAHVIRSYHPEAKLPEDDNGLRGLYLSLLEGKKVLLLMDNAANAEQVKPLNPLASSIMIVTSRNHFPFSGFFVKKLDALEPKDATQLLWKIAPQIGEYADKVAELCGYLPLALEVAASALNKAVNLTPAAYIKRLELVEASLKLSYDLLSKRMQRLWRSLAVFPNTFDDNAVSTLWGTKIEDTQDWLAELISYSLVQWNETTGRYRLHDLVRLFADGRLSEKERLISQKAHAAYFRNLLTQANDYYLKGNEEMTRGLALYDLEYENIEVGQRWSASLTGKDDTATSLCMHYYIDGVQVLDLRLHPRESINWLEASLKAANLLGDKHNEGDALGCLGIAYKYLGEPHKAIELHQQHLVISREIGNRRGEGNALGNLGLAYAELGEPRKAIELFQQRIVIAREIGDRRDEANALGCLGNVYAALDESHKAIEFHQQHLAIARGIGDRKGEGNALGCLGIAYAQLDEPHKAIKYFQQHLAIAREIGDRRGEGNALGNLGIAYKNIGEPHKAIEFHQQHLVISRGIGDRRGEGNAHWNCALAYDKLGYRTEAISFAEIALVIYEQIESPNISKVRLFLEKWKSEQA